MNKNDFKLILILVLISLIFITYFKVFNDETSNTAYVYYENEVVLKIDLTKDSEYDVEGYNGNIHIVVKDNKIKVDEENSPKHLCSKQGFISSSNESIVCLPNKVVIKILSKDDIDIVVGG